MWMKYFKTLCDTVGRGMKTPIITKINIGLSSIKVKDGNQTDTDDFHIYIFFSSLSEIIKNKATVGSKTSIEFEIFHFLL